MCANITIDSVPTPLTALALDNPYYDAITNSLYTGDVLGLYFCRYSYVDKQIYCGYILGLVQIAFVIPLQNHPNLFVIGASRSACIVQWDGFASSGTVLETLFTLPFGTVLNSALVGPDNSLYIGTYGLTLCVVNPDYPMFRYTRQTGLVQISRGFESTVGMFIVQSTRTFYQLDGCSKILTAFNWDPCTGAICKREKVFLFILEPLLKCCLRFPANQRQVIHFRYPDTGILIGFAGDCRGHLYTGFYNGSIVVEIDPTYVSIMFHIKKCSLA